MQMMQSLALLLCHPMQWYLYIFKCDLCIQKHANDAIFASKCNDI